MEIGYIVGMIIMGICLFTLLILMLCGSLQGCFVSSKTHKVIEELRQQKIEEMLNEKDK